MKLYSIIATIVAGAAAFGITACDNIDSDDRYIELPDVVIDEDEIPRWVLLEEFTGQLCVNCPAAHDIIKSLSAQWGERFVPVSIHCGAPTFGIPESTPGLVGLQTEQGEAYFNAYGGLGSNKLPCGIVNRQGGMLGSAAWADPIRTLMGTTSPLNMQIAPEVNGSNLDIVLNVSASEAVDGKLLVWVVESDIVAMQQLLGNKTDMNYVHNHVFRASVNGADGDDLKIEAHADASMTFSIPLASTWNPDHLAVVAFVYTPTEVVQTIHAETGHTVANFTKK